ncbi:coenzyme F390 synthetase [Providencia burhodogranariea DSM 19968]|uniref:Coenzyme F390 synthetase n=2 Tax=Providencia burhodogranariea TaxID=516074 RepID=K8WTT5_9GAMM|nr:hypothetical protein [Providencia burhodogranariea]EKT59615.1 coenzyme F390 synthetase [Providencia burhodogranariea DSM 19968]
MEHTTVNIHDYITNLSAINQQRYTFIIDDIAAKLVEMNLLQTATTENEDSINDFIFLPEGLHPIHTNMHQVFSKSFQELALRQPRLPEEIPVIFIGYHAQNRLSKKQQTKGFLLTDQTLYIQDNFSTLFEQSLPRSYALPNKNEDINSFIHQIIVGYHWSDKQNVPAIGIKIEHTLIAMISVILNHHKQCNSLIKPQPEIILERLLQLYKPSSLHAKTDNKQKKTLANVAKKFAVPAMEEIIYSITDNALFGGAYGVAVTKNALYSKELFESPKRFPITELSETLNLKLSDDRKNIIVTDNRTLYLPNRLDEKDKQKAIKLIQETIELLRG